MIRWVAVLLSTLSLGCTAAGPSNATTGACPDYLNQEVRRLHSQETVNLCQYYRPGKPLLIVNTASHCGYTRQFSGLEALYQKYQQDGLVILGFPSNSFKQEEKSEEGTASVCYQNYGVTFPMFEHVEVTGAQAHPLFQHLASQAKPPAWNFNKYLATDAEIKHFGSKVEPLESDLEQQIAQRLQPPRAN